MNRMRKWVSGVGRRVSVAACPAVNLFYCGVAAAVLLAGGGTRVALGDDPPAALFRGGSRHGYDEARNINTTDARRSRNNGGARAGYTLAAVANVKVLGVLPAGTVFTIR